MDRIGIGFVGLRFGLHIIENQILTGSGAPYFKLEGICDMDPARLEFVAAKVPGVATYTSLDDLLTADAIRAVALFSGPNGRADLIRRIIRTGRDVITTKPFEMDVAKAEGILREARELGRVIHLNSPAPRLPEDLRLIRQWRKTHDLGRPLWATYQQWYRSHRELADGTWYDSHELCPGGAMLRLGIYGINDLVSIFGEPVEVQCAGSRIATTRPTPDLSSMTIRFENGGLANIVAALCMDDTLGGRMALAVYFERGAIFRNGSVQPLASQARAHTLSLSLSSQPAGTVTETRTISDSSGQYQWDVFYQSIQGNASAGLIEPEEVVRGVRVLDAMARSFTSGRTEPLAPYPVGDA